RFRGADRGDGVPPRGDGGAAVLRAEGGGHGSGDQSAPRADARGAQEIAGTAGRVTCPRPPHAVRLIDVLSRALGAAYHSRCSRISVSRVSAFATTRTWSTLRPSRKSRSE